MKKLCIHMLLAILSVSFLFCFALSPASVRAESNLDGAVWNADYSELTLTSSVAGTSLRTEVAKHADSLTKVIANEGSAITGSLADVFSECSLLKRVDFYNCNISSVNNIDATFYACSALISITFPTTGTPVLRSMATTFQACESLKELDLSMIDTSQVTDMSGLFFNCPSLTTLNINTWKTPKLENTANMFVGCSSLKSLDLSHFSFQNITDNCLMFANCSSLETLNLGNMIPKAPVDNISPGYGMFCEFNPYTEEIIGTLPHLSSITMSSECSLEPGTGLYTYDCTGTFFNYGHPAGWNAYKNDVFQTTLYSFSDFQSYQQSHPGMSAYVWGDGPQPGSTDGWKQSEAGWQYVVDGNATVGWLWIDDTYGAHWYYFKEDTYMACNQWKWDEENSSWYWLCGSGPMIQGLWQWIDNEWYGFWWNGKMCRGWVWDADWSAWFYCYNSGVMARTIWVGSYWVNCSGVWIR